MGALSCSYTPPCFFGTRQEQGRPTRKLHVAFRPCVRFRVPFLTVLRLGMVASTSLFRVRATALHTLGLWDFYPHILICCGALRNPHVAVRPCDPLSISRLMFRSGQGRVSFLR